MKRIVYFIAEDKAFLSHRLNVAKAAKKSGFDVYLMTHVTTHEAEINHLGFPVKALHHFSRGGMNPVKDLRALFEILKIYKEIKPDVVHHVAWKPVLYGSIAARLAKVPRVINALTGMGYLFISTSFKARFIKNIIKILLPFILKLLNHVMIVQNPDDQKLVEEDFKVDPQHIKLIQGSGVDTHFFKPAKTFPTGRLQFVCVSRMLWDKGIYELVEATRLAKLTHASFDVILCGDTDEANPAAIPSDQLKQWAKQGLIIWKGHVRDVSKTYLSSHVAVLPSYREGLPKSLLEAAACGLPIITTDAPGCREIVKENKNGYLVPIKNIRKLAQAICLMIDNPKLRITFGANSREMVLKYFSDEIIITKTLKLYGKPESSS